MGRRPEIIFRNCGLVAWAACMVALLAPVARGRGDPVWQLAVIGGAILIGMGATALLDVGGVRGRIQRRWGGSRGWPNGRFGTFASALYLVVGLAWLCVGLAAGLD